MSTMQSFRNYFIWIIAFFVVSVILENALINDMYDPINGATNGNVTFTGSINTDLEVTVEEARATNVNGYLIVKVKNITGHYIDKCCAKIDLYTERNILAATKYVDISDFDVNQTKKFKINFKGNEIGSYAVSLQEDAPDKTYILDLFGFEVDIRNVFGMDLSSIINPESLKETGVNLWGLTLGFLKTVPAWAYLIAGGIVIWHMPKGFLFGIFPF
ncbi:MAG: hypothetical protein OSJ66_04220 [Clostridia bacterium]|nr:hypothetical protein [Clostridia bacterium]